MPPESSGLSTDPPVADTDTDEVPASDVVPIDFGAWYAAVAPRLTRTLAAVTRDRQVAQDVAAEACARAWARWDRLVAGGETPDGWVYRVAFNLVRSSWRRARRSSPLPTPDSSTVDGFETVDPELWAAVRGLPRRQQQAVFLRYVADMGEREIAAVLQVSEGAVSASLSTARATLRSRLHQEGARHGR